MGVEREWWISGWEKGGVVWWERSGVGERERGVGWEMGGGEVHKGRI